MPMLRERDIPTTLRRMSTDDVVAWCDSFEQGSANHVLGQLELQRRRDRGLKLGISIAIGLAVAALVVAAAALFYSAR
jgi:hypothetical protein